jgi:hypothetical protein
MKQFGNIKRRSEFYVYCNRSPNVGAFAKLGNATISFVMSLSPSVSHGTTRLPLERLSWKLVFEYFSKICGENSSFIKVRQERVLYVKTNIHF